MKRQKKKLDKTSSLFVWKNNTVFSILIATYRYSSIIGLHWSLSMRVTSQSKPRQFAVSFTAVIHRVLLQTAELVGYPQLQYTYSIQPKCAHQNFWLHVATLKKPQRPSYKNLVPAPVPCLLASFVQKCLLHDLPVWVLHIARKYHFFQNMQLPRQAVKM